MDELQVRRVEVEKNFEVTWVAVFGCSLVFQSGCAGGLGKSLGARVRSSFGILYEVVDCGLYCTTSIIHPVYYNITNKRYDGDSDYYASSKAVSNISTLTCFPS